jgi:hypothetical protein
MPKARFLTPSGAVTDHRRMVELSLTQVPRAARGEILNLETV